MKTDRLIAWALAAGLAARAQMLYHPTTSAPSKISDVDGFPHIPTCVPVGPVGASTRHTTSVVRPAPNLWSWMPSQPLDDGPLACLITQNESKLCLPPGTYDLGRPMIYDFPYADVVKLALPHGGLADFGINGDVASFNESCNDSTIIDVVTMTSVPAEVGRANLTLQLPVDPPVACLFSEAHYRGAVKCFGLGALILPAAMLNQTASIWLHGGALAIGYGANGTRTAFSVLMSNPGNLNEMMTVSDLYLTELLVELLPTNGVCPNGYTIAQIGDA